MTGDENEGGESEGGERAVRAVDAETMNTTAAVYEGHDGEGRHNEGSAEAED